MLVTLVMIVAVAVLAGGSCVLSANRQLSRFPDQEVRSFPVYQSVKVYKGALLGWVGGYVRPLITGDAFAGIAYENMDNSSGSDGALSVRVFVEGDFVHYLSGAEATNNGRCVYASADDTILLSGDANTLVGQQLGLHAANYIVLRLAAVGEKSPSLPHLGTESYPFTRTTATKFGQVYVRSNAATGTARGLYLRHHFAGGCGGEAFRAYGTVEAAAPVDTCNGAHISLDFGTSAGTGNCTGQANAGRFTFHLPTGRTIGGTLSVVRAEAWADGAAPNVSNFAFFTAESGGNGTGAVVIDTKAHLLRIVSAAAEGSMVEAGSTLGTAYGGIKCLVNGTKMYIPLYSAAPS